MSIAVDPSTPAFSQAIPGQNLSSGASSGNITQTSASFSPPAKSLVVVMAAATYSWCTTAFASTGLSVSDSHGNAYTASKAQTIGSSRYGAVEFFWFYYATMPGSTTVTVTLASAEVDGNGTGVDIYPLVLSGTSSTQTSPASAGANNTAANQQLAITTTTTGSWVLAVDLCGSDSGDAMTGTVGLTTLGWVEGDAGQNTVLFGRSTSATGTPGAATFGWTISAGTNPKGTIALLEILPQSATTITDSDASGTTVDAGETLYVVQRVTDSDVSHGTDAGENVNTGAHITDSDASNATVDRELTAWPRDTEAGHGTDAGENIVTAAGTLVRDTDSCHGSEQFAKVLAGVGQGLQFPVHPPVLPVPGSMLRTSGPKPPDITENQRGFRRVTHAH